MNKSRFTEEQSAYALRLAKGGAPVADVCRQVGISDATSYTWKKNKPSWASASCAKLSELEDENARPKSIVADLTLHKQILQVANSAATTQTAVPREQLPPSVSRHGNCWDNIAKLPF